MHDVVETLALGDWDERGIDTSFGRLKAQAQSDSVVISAAEAGVVSVHGHRWIDLRWFRDNRHRPDPPWR
jgi:hypothetical protein